MESAKLKNIILTILVIANVLLLSLVVIQRMDSRRHRQQVLDDAVALLAQRGIALQADALPDQDFPAPLTLERDAAWELETFTDLLGEGAALTQRGLVSLYTGPFGSAELRSNGGFHVTLAPEAYPLAPGEDMQTHAQSLIQRLGFPAQVTGQDEHGVTAVQVCPASGSSTRFPVFSCTVRVIYENGAAVRMEGTRLMGTPTDAPQHSQSLSTATLLVRFRSGVIDSGDACTAILSATQGYILSADANDSLRLTPVLRLETDTNLYIVNALTGELSRASRA